MSIHFLTTLDSRAAIKGSRDPLGLQPIWVHFGRQVVGNLTTVTTMPRDFRTTVLGMYLGEWLIQEGRAREEDRLSLFLKFEQIAAYSQYAHADEDLEPMRGITRVKARSDSSRQVTISAEPKYQILAAQKQYGLWGLYSAATANAGWLNQATHQPTEAGREMVERIYLPGLERVPGKAGAVAKFVAQPETKLEPRGRHRRLTKAVSDVLTASFDGEEGDRYRRELVFGEGGDNPTKGKQAALWGVLEDINDSGFFGWDTTFAYEELCEARKRAERDAPELARALQEIATVEPLLAASSWLFSFALQRNRGSLAQVAEEVRNVWGATGAESVDPDKLVELHGTLARASDSDTADRLVSMGRLLREGEYSQFIRKAVEQNEHVMRARGGAPWLSIRNEELDVRLPERDKPLPSPEELRRPWVNSYFIDSLKRVGAGIFGKT